MRIERLSFSVRSSSRFEVLDVTDEIQSWLTMIKAIDGIALISVPHTTAALTINEAEGGLKHDIVDAAKGLFNPDAPWKHNLVDNNAHAHLTSIFIGPFQCAPVEEGRLRLGTWQRVLLIEMDGPRSRTVNVKYVGL
ncbi:MAG: secondary thiamine-phosphate synthase enzyme YjbQ [Acidilobus sp.]